MNQDYIAAKERLRLLDNPRDDDRAKEVYGKTCYLPSNPAVRADKATVYDFEHDTRPASVEWLREVVCKQDEYGCGAMYFHISRDVGVCVDPDGMVAVAIDYINRFANPTRGEVLTLLRLFKERKV